MGSAQVFRRSLRRLALSRLDIQVDRLVVQALRAAFPGPGRLLLNAGTEAGLDPEVALARACAGFLNFAAFNLADDVSDGECDYLAANEATAVLLILNNLFYSELHQLELPRAVEEQILSDLISAEESQVIEIMTTSWNAERLWTTTDGIAGRQWSAYLHIVWADTMLADMAKDVAHNFGRVALLAGDIDSHDVRYTSLPLDDQRKVLGAALHSLRTLESVDVQFYAEPIASCKKTITEELMILSRPAAGLMSISE